MNDLSKLLSLDERDAVVDLFRHEGFLPFMKLVDGLVSEQEHAVLKLDSAQGAEKLFHSKLKAEGARKLAKDVQVLVEKYKEQERKQRANAQRPK